MSDVSLGDLGSSSNPLPGLSASDYEGYGSGGNITGNGGSDPGGSYFGGLSSGTLGSLGALGVGALGFGAILGTSSNALPAQYGQAEGQVPWLQNTGQQITNTGQSLVAGGQSALTMAENGQLTPAQQAQLQVFGTGLTNQTRQQFYNMGQNPDQSTAFISQTASNDAQVNAMAQQQIQSTIQLGLGEISGGNSLISQGAGFESAANNILLQAGQAQLQADKDYSSSLTSAFSSIASLFGAGVKLAAL